MVSLAVNRSSARRSQVTLISQVRTEWLKVHPDWTQLGVLARGPDDTYTGAPYEQRQRVRQLDTELASGKLDLEEGRSKVSELTPSSTTVVEFFSYLSELILDGRVRPSEVYSVLGPDVARHGRTIRWVLGLGEVKWAPSDFIDDRGTSWNQWTDYVNVNQFHDRTERILLLFDCLWATLARRGDHNWHLILFCAQVKQNGSGEHCRRRAIRLAAERGRWIHGIRLQRLLLESEYVRLRSIHKDRDPLPVSMFVDWAPEKLVRQGRWRRRALRTCIRALRLELERPKNFP